MAESVAEEEAAQETLEDWIMSEVQNGFPLQGIYPPNEAALERYRKR